ncbi:MAG: hypothetical protein ABFD82_10635 [Syntrophaceae bacterium]
MTKKSGSRIKSGMTGVRDDRMPPVSGLPSRRGDTGQAYQVRDDKGTG